MSKVSNFDRFFNEALNQMLSPNSSLNTSYPPYNVILTDGGFEVQIAAAGFKREDMTIELKNNLLTVSGAKVDDSAVKYHYRGIAGRSWKLSWTVQDGAEITGAKFQDGILSIYGLNKPKEENKKVIEIN